MTIEICIGSSCHLKGSYNVIQTLQHLLEERNLYDRVTLKSAFCMRQCEKDVAISVDGKIYSVKPENTVEFFDNTVVPLLNKENN
jgi:NADH:ubiquinone oxidoreductase subunit E